MLSKPLDLYIRCCTTEQKDSHENKAIKLGTRNKWPLFLLKFKLSKRDFLVTKFKRALKQCIRKKKKKTIQNKATNTRKRCFERKNFVLLLSFDRCIALNSIGVFIVEELIHCQGHPKIHDCICVLLASVTVSRHPLCMLCTCVCCARCKRAFYIFVHFPSKQQHVRLKMKVNQFKRTMAILEPTPVVIFSGRVSCAFLRVFAAALASDWPL